MRHTVKPLNILLGFSLALFSGALAPLALAQDRSELTAEELALLFEKQKTRGLVIVPTGQSSPTVTVESTAIASEVTYVAVEKEDQVNIRVAFDFDSASLRDDQKPKLSTLCQVMNAVDVKLFQIVGHTDSSGTAEYNQTLSLLRAQEVKRYLVNDCGVAEHRLIAIGVGESTPFDADDPSSDANRRVEFQALS